MAGLPDLLNFVTKFSDLWKSNKSARLAAECHGGQATVSLHLQLGPHTPEKVHQPPPRPSPSRLRRRARRAQARAEAAANAASTEDTAVVAEVEDGNLAAEASKTSAAGEVETNDANLEDTNCKSAEQAKIDFQCLICDFSSSWECGLHIHMTKNHVNIEQVDGTILDDDLEEDAQYSETSNYWKTGRLGTAYQAFIDANDIIEKSNLPEGVKKCEITKILNSAMYLLGTGSCDDYRL